MRVSTAGVAVQGQRYFLAQRQPGTSIGEVWEFPGGKKRDDENVEKALEREFFEEFRVSVRVLRHLYSGVFFNDMKQYQQEAYFIEIQDENFELTEHQAVGWFTLGEIETLPMADSDKKIFEALKEKLFA